MNILFTCAGRRNYLLQYFRETLKHKGKIIAADMEITAPALAVADKAVVVPEIYSSEYVHVILDICIKENVNALISLNDLELPILASQAQKFEEIGVKLVVSNEKAIETCFDKYKTIQFCKKIQIGYPKTFLDLDCARDALLKHNVKFPVVVKPRWGSASVGLEFPRTMEELDLAFRLVSLKISNSILYQASRQQLDKAVIIQEKIDGIEYGLDVLNNFSGLPMQVYVKEKLAMRAGETDKSVLRNKPDMEDLGIRIGRALGHIGNLDCDIFESRGRYYLLEMNPRFGGGYPFSHMSGANYPAAICSWIEGLTFSFEGFTKEYDKPYAKCDTIIQVLK